MTKLDFGILFTKKYLRRRTRSRLLLVAHDYYNNTQCVVCQDPFEEKFCLPVAHTSHGGRRSKQTVERPLFAQSPRSPFGGGGGKIADKPTARKSWLEVAAMRGAAELARGGGRSDTAKRLLIPNHLSSGIAARRTLAGEVAPTVRRADTAERRRRMSKNKPERRLPC